MPRGRAFTEDEQRRAVATRRAGAAARRQAKLTAYRATVDALVRDSRPMPPWAENFVEKARGGNLRAMLALKCADCSGFQREEIRLCPVVSCPLHPLRPYQQRDGAEAAARDDTDSIAAEADTADTADAAV